MLKAIISRIKQGYRTYPFPAKPPVMPERFRGRPILYCDKCNQCRMCEKNCPTGAVVLKDNKICIDLGKCIFCGKCKQICSNNVIEFSKDYRLAANQRNDLLISDAEVKLAQAIDKKSQRIFGRSLKLRQVSAGGCNACEADTNVLTTLTYDLARFGIQFVASPRHADGILVTGPVTENMKLALKKTYDAIPAPKFVIAVGACAISGGIYAGHSEVNDGINGIVPVDLYIPGCPPHPYTILDGLITFLGRI
jgi:Ni,Fe-hydrogenase III small subunit/Pyruvate/2-oxoacid:ferredoxin oxidoreductase delta subunit